MTYAEMKMKEIRAYISYKGYTITEVADKLGVKKQSLTRSLTVTKSITRLEELEKNIKEVI